MPRWTEPTRRSIGLLALAVGLGSAPIAAQRSAADAAVDAAVDSVIRQAMTERGIPGMAVAVFRDGQLVRRSYHGVANAEFGVPVDSATVFALYSMSKVFAAVMVMRLVEDGLLALDAPIGTWLPELPADWRSLTARQLLTLTSGLPDVGNPALVGADPATLTREAALAALRERPFRSAPGTAWDYSQTNHLLLALLVERVTGEPYDTAVAARVFAPAGMVATSFADFREVVPRRSTWYSRFVETDSGWVPSERLRLQTARYPVWLHSAAGANATLDDLIAFERALAGGALIGRAGRDAMWTNGRFVDGRPIHLEGYYAPGWALGWWYAAPDGRRAVGMSGGATVGMQRHLDEGVTVIVLTNLQGAGPEQLLESIAAPYLAAVRGRR